MHPDAGYGVSDRIAGGLIAYACGDALGLPWEGRLEESAGVSAGQVEQLPARGGWPRGSTSDDTALTLLVAHHLAERGGDGDARAFLAELAERAPRIRGLGPTTSAAVERFRRGAIPAASGGVTNGAAMRALPIGWAVPHAQAGRRRRTAIELSRATHAAPSALAAACVVAACASWALEDADPGLLLEIATEEARDAARAVSAGMRLAGMLAQLARQEWAPSARGVSLDPYETVTAVLYCVTRASSLRGALVRAVQLGGDTDTVAALAGGLLGCRLTPGQVRAELPWHRFAVLPEPESVIAETAAALAASRAARPV